MKNLNAAGCFALIAAVLMNQSLRCEGDILDRKAIAARQDQLRNLIVQCDEIRTYDIDPSTAAKVPSHFRQPPIDLKRKETASVTFSFLNGRARYDRELDKETLKYWFGKGLPAIWRQSQTVSVTGKIEELTTQRFKDSLATFGGLRQFKEFSPDLTIDVAFGLRLFGERQWLTNADLDKMDEIQSDDKSLVILRDTGGDGHIHELHFDKHLLYALVYYRCTGFHGASVEIVNSNFHRYGNVFIPGKTARTSNIADSTGHIRHPICYTLAVNHVSFNDSSNTGGRYAILWPAHLRLFDARTNDRIEVGPTTRPMSDDDIRHQLAEKRMHELMFDQLAAERIGRALHANPTTRP